MRLYVRKFETEGLHIKWPSGSPWLSWFRMVLHQVISSFVFVFVFFWYKEFKMSFASHIPKMVCRCFITFFVVLSSGLMTKGEQRFQKKMFQRKLRLPQGSAAGVWTGLIAATSTRSSDVGSLCRAPVRSGHDSRLESCAHKASTC